MNLLVIFCPVCSEVVLLHRVALKKGDYVVIQIHYCFWCVQILYLYFHALHNFYVTHGNKIYL